VMISMEKIELWSSCWNQLSDFFYILFLLKNLIKFLIRYLMFNFWCKICFLGFVCQSSFLAYSSYLAYIQLYKALPFLGTTLFLSSLFFGPISQ
jgi:hypothetical protein